MKKLLYLLSFISVLTMMGSCKKEVEIPLSANPPTFSLTADTVAVANGKYILKAEGQSAYGGAMLSKVEFYKADEKIGEKTIAPYTLEYQVTENVPDQQLSFYAVLIDVAGNRVKSSTVKPKVKVLPIRIEAENATLTGLAKVATDPDTKATSSNQAKVGAIDNAASGIDATIQILTPGDYLIKVAAGTGLDGTSHKVYIDNNAADAKIYNIPNRGWNVWQTFNLIFRLEAGTHKISIRQNVGYGELDYFEYSKF
ncbi:carbohydrate-binding protein [Niabella aquatica]